MARASLEETRADLLAAGERLVRSLAKDRSERVDGALGHLGAAEVATEAGLSKGMLYHVWSSQEAYRRDLLLHLARAATTESFVATESPELVAGFQTLEDAIAGVSMATMERALTDEQWYVFMEVSSFVANAEVRGQLAQGQAIALEAAASFYELGLAIWGHRVRDGFSAHDLVYLTRAYSRGVTLQAMVDPGPFFEQRPWNGGERSLYEVGVLAMFRSLLEPIE